MKQAGTMLARGRRAKKRSCLCATTNRYFWLPSSGLESSGASLFTGSHRACISWKTSARSAVRTQRASPSTRTATSPGYTRKPQVISTRSATPTPVGFRTGWRGVRAIQSGVRHQQRRRRRRDLLDANFNGHGFLRQPDRACRIFSPRSTDRDGDVDPG